MGMPTTAPGLRQRKREATRSKLLSSAADLFEEHGYDGTTVADIADRAEVGARTFFNYFASKEELLFPAREARARTAIEAIASRSRNEEPAEVLLRALATIAEPAATPEESTTKTAERLDDRIARLQARFIETAPAVRGRALQIQFDTQREIARELRAAFADDLDPLTAGALVGAFVGAFGGAAQGLADSRDEEAGGGAGFEAVHRATLAALGQWSQAVASKAGERR